MKKITNMVSANGNKVPNQFIIEDDAGRIFFQSYDSIIAKVESNRIELDEKYWNYSTTTAKYRNKFLEMTTKEIKEKIKSGEIVLSKLND
jgi:hypothetical protein